MNEENFITKLEGAPQEAAKNIDNANFFEVSPDSYIGLKPFLNKDVESVEKVPEKLEASTEEFIGQSEQHRSLASEDYHKLNFIEKRLRYYKERIIDLPELNRENINLYNKKMDEGLSEEEQEFLEDSNLALNEMTENTFGIDSEGEQLFVEVLSGVGDILRSYTENKALIAGFAISGATVGIAAGLGVPLPGAAPVGATAGFITGITVGFGAAGFVDGYKMMKGSTYKELSFARDEEGNPLVIDESTKTAVSYGVGVIGGVASALSSLVLVKGNPLLKRFISPKLAVATLIKNPALLAKVSILGHMARSALAEGGEEGLQEFVQIVGVNFAKLDESEASFINALSNSVNEDSGERVSRAALLGGLIGSTFAGVTSIPGHKGLKERIGKAQQLARQRELTLNRQNKVLEVAATVNSTKVKEFAPGEMSSFKKKLYSAIGFTDEVWTTLEDIQEFASTPEKREAIRKVVDPTGDLNKLGKELNTPMLLQEQEALEIIEQFPDFSDYMRLEPDSESPKEIRSKAQEQVTRLEQAQVKREELLSSLGVDEKLTSEQEAEIQAILIPEDEAKIIESETEFLEDVGFEPIEGIVTKEDVEILNTKELDAKLEVARSLKEDVDKKFQRSEDRIFKDVDAKDIQREIKDLTKEHEIINRFKDATIKDESTVNHKQKGFSPLAIDPRSLSEDLKEIYLKDPKLKKRKVFVEGGLHVNESASLAGVESAADLLKLLSETPTKSEIIKNRDQRRIELRNRIRQTIAPTRSIERDKAFSKLTTIRIRQMKYIASKEWATFKRGIIKIGGRPPTIEGLNRKARLIISKTFIKDLNPKRFELGEKTSRKKAMDNWLNTEFEQTYKNLEAAALNNELRKEALNNKDKITKFEKFWKNVDKPNIQQLLKDAGMLKSMQEFTDVFRLTVSGRGLKELKSFNNFIKQQVEEGNYTPVIPDRLADATQSVRDLTVEQFLVISEMGEFIVNQAKLKNKLFNIAQERKDLITAEKIAEEVEEKTKANVNFDPKKAERKPKRSLTKTEGWMEGVKTFLSSVASIKTIVAELDGFKIEDGFFHRIIGRPIKEKFTSKRLEMSSVEANDKKIVTQYGMKKFKKLYNSPITIPEFSDIPSLGDGKGGVGKTDLLVLQAYMGDPQGREAIANFITRKGEKLSIEKVQAVLDRELDNADVALVQSLMVDRFKRFEKRSFDLHKRTTGIEPTMIKGITVRHRGKELPGGYYPIRRQIVPDDVKAKNFLEKIKDKFNDFSGIDENHFFAKMRTAEMTEQGRLKERAKSDRPLDLNFDNVFEFTEEAIHDLHFREVGIDVLKILKNPFNVKNMKSVIGPKKFTVLLNHVKDVISKTTEQETTLFSEEYGAVNKAIGTIHSLHAVKAIGFNLTSALIQVDSLKNLSLRLGPKTNLYLIKQAKKMSSNLILFEEYTKLAEAINPDIKFEKDGIDSAIIKESYDWIPSTQNFFSNYNAKTAQRVSSIRDLQKKVIDASFFMVREGDRINKILATLAISDQFLNGDVEGIPLSKLEKMSDSEKATKLRSVVQQTIDLSLTASSPADKTALEKNKVAKLFLRYWTDRRSGLNSTVAQIQKTQAAIKRGEGKQAVKHLGTLALVAGVSAAWMVGVRQGVDETIKKLKVRSPEDAAELAKDTLWWFATAPFNQLAETIPLIDNITFAADLDIRSDYRNVGVPFFGVMSDIAMGRNALLEILKATGKGKLVRLSEVNQKALLTNMGYILGGAPTNSIIKLSEALQSREVKTISKYLKNTVKDLNKEINLFIDAFKDKPETGKFIDDLKEYQKENLPQFDANVKEIIPEGTKEIIKEVSSGGDWAAFDPDTGAAGIYQFTEQRWNEIAELNASLGLTENGRVSKDTSQQERAMVWSIEDITKGLIALDVPVTLKTLFGAHKFGVDNYVKIHNAGNEEKLSKLIDENDSLFKNFKTVKSVKDFVSKKIKEVR